jgi:LPXTG-site transpeptidase (sortase) family protein
VDITFNFAVTKSSVKSLPKTGFAPNRVTVLPAQANGAAYTKMSGLWLDIPSQKLQVSIVGVPQLNDQWDVSWLGSSAGWLTGTAFPTWVGNSVITAHVTHANGLPGPFANLKNLMYGEQIVVHLYGAKYTYEVRDSRQVSSGATNYALEHLPDYSYLTLITCQNYDFLTDAYTYRRVVRAVLVSIAAE